MSNINQHGPITTQGELTEDKNGNQILINFKGKAFAIDSKIGLIWNEIEKSNSYQEEIEDRLNQEYDIKPDNTRSILKKLKNAELIQ